MKKEKGCNGKKEDLWRQAGVVSQIEQIIFEKIAGWKKETDRRKVLPLGNHLLKDLGLDKEGRLLQPASQLSKKRD